MRLMKPVGLFRQDYGYCNSCFLTAGQIIPKVTGKPWEVYIYDSLIAPLQMTHTQTLSGNAGSFSNVAKPYTTLFTGALQKLPYDHIDNIAPAGSIVSCVSDMAHWLQMQLDTGKFNGTQVVPKPVVLKTRDVNISVGSRKSTVYPIHFRGYGLGVFAADYNGRQIYYHTGGAFGFVSNTCFVPEENLGIVILTNNDAQSFFELLRYQILDAYLGVPFTNRQVAPLKQYVADKKEEKAFLDTMNDLKSKKLVPSIAIENYAGVYSNPVYGEIKMKANGNNQLNVEFTHHAKLSATLTYLGNDDWELRYNNIGYGIFKTKFAIDKYKVRSISVKAADFIEYDPYLFTKME
jgi:CubicO group peptidase (beta-lactamase class C family)